MNSRSHWLQSWLTVLVTLIVISHAAKNEATAKTSKAKAIDMIPDNLTIPDDYSLRVIEGGWMEIHVVRPTHLAFTIEPATPGNEWVLQENSSYTVTVEIYVNKSKKNPSKDIAISVEFPTDLFHLEFKSKNGTYFVIKALKPGQGSITGSLDGTVNDDGTVTKIGLHKVLGKQEFRIYPELRVSPTSIFLPWDSDVKPSYVLRPVASGATGIYHWESMHPTFATVSYKSGDKSSASPSIVTAGKGSSKIFAFDAQSYTFKKPVNVEISDVEEIQVVPGISETYVGESVYINLAMYGKPEGGKQLKPFDNCSQIPVELNIVEKNRFKQSAVVEDAIVINPHACQTIKLDCISSGPSRVWIHYRNPSTGKQVNSTTVISCFSPLKVEHPTSDQMIALATSIEVVFEGGPHKWPEKPQGYFSTLTPADPEVFRVNPILDPHRYRRELHVFRVTCLKLGSTQLTVKIGNEVSATLRQPAVLEKNVTLHCAAPKALTIKPRLRKESKCPLSGLFKLPISFSHPSQLELNAIDDMNRVFYNISSLRIDWSLSDYTVAKLSANRDFEEIVNGAPGYRKWLRNVMTLTPLNKESKVIVTAKASAYRSDVLKNELISSNYQDLTEIKTEVSFSLVDKPSIEPKEITLFNHEENKGVFQLSKGSGYFKLEMNSSDNAAVLQYDESLKIITAKPVRDGRIRFKIVDSCIDNANGADEFIEGSVRVVDPTQISFKSVEKIEIGNTSDIEVEVLDSTGGVIPSRFHSLMNLQAEIISPTSTLTVTKIDTDSTSKSLYRLTAVGLGRGQILFKTGSAQLNIYHKVIQSSPVSIEIFSPIGMSANQLNIAVGSVVELTTTGGPLDASITEFKSSDPTIASISSTGYLEAHEIGFTSITIRSVGIINKLIYTQKEIEINVFPSPVKKVHHPPPPPSPQEQAAESSIPVEVKTPPQASFFDGYQSSLTMLALFAAFFFTYHHWLQRRQVTSVVDHSLPPSVSRNIWDLQHSPPSARTSVSPSLSFKPRPNSSPFASQRPVNLASSGVTASERAILSTINRSTTATNSPSTSTASPTSTPKLPKSGGLWTQPRS